MTKQLRAKITDLKAPNDQYVANNPTECKDDTDRSAYKALADMPNERVIQMGMVCVERV